jgi:CG-1 domain
VFLFDRRAVRFFRKDGHSWRKKADGKTVRETHEKLKVPACRGCAGVLTGIPAVAATTAA